MTSSKNFLFREFHATRPSYGCHFVKIFSEIERGKIKVGGSFDLIGSKETCSIFIQYTRTAGNLSKFGVHTSNCCLKKWAKESLDVQIGSCEPT